MSIRQKDVFEDVAVVVGGGVVAVAAVGAVVGVEEDGQEGADHQDVGVEEQRHIIQARKPYVSTRGVTVNMRNSLQLLEYIKYNKNMHLGAIFSQLCTNLM